MNEISLVVMNKPTLAYVTSAYNETLNLEELHRRCRLAWQSLAKETAKASPKASESFSVMSFGYSRQP